MLLHSCLSEIGCDDVVGPEGMEKFCEDIGVEPENVSRFLAFWLLCLFGLSLLAFHCFSLSGRQSD